MASTFSSCSTVKKTDDTVTGEVGSASGQWRGKALARDLKNKKSGSLDLEILAQEPERLRMEIVGSFGVHLASVALNSENAYASMTREKKFVVAPADDTALSSLLPLSISPRNLLRVLFNRPLPKREWNCQSEGKKQNCVNSTSGVTVTSEEQDQGRRQIKIASPDAEVNMVLAESRSKVEFNDNAFMLSAPKGYRVQRH